MKLLAFLSVLFLLSSCATQTYNVAGNASADHKKKELQTFFIAGIGQEQEMNAAEICGGVEKVGKVQSKLNFVDALLAIVTFGIYTPRTATVYCTE